MTQSIAFVAGLAFGTILGFLCFLLLFWLAKHLNEADGVYYDDYEEEEHNN